jgi:hypothetical protein
MSRWMDDDGSIDGWIYGLSIDDDDDDGDD